MTTKELCEKIEKLEKELADLKAAPVSYYTRTWTDKMEDILPKYLLNSKNPSAANLADKLCEIVYTVCLNDYKRWWREKCDGFQVYSPLDATRYENIMCEVLTVLEKHRQDEFVDLSALVTKTNAL